MVLILLICIVLSLIGNAYLFIRLREVEKIRRKIDLDLQEMFKQKISDKDLKFLDFTVDMYIKYAKELDIYSEHQHEYIVTELERIRTSYLVKS